MLTKADVATPNVIEGWLHDMSIATALRADPASNWMLEFTVPGSNPLVVNVVNPKALPRAVMFVCGLVAAPGHEAAFKALDEGSRKKFWQQLRATLNREFVEFQADGAWTECPKSVRVTAVRFDDGLTLDSFGRTLNSVCKACGDAIAHFTDNLGDPSPPLGGEFAFKKTGTQ
jgi:hypothetical protein